MQASRRRESSTGWNLWHGCHKISEGCKHCYVYRGDMRYGSRDPSVVAKTSNFDLPVRTAKNGWAIPSGTMVYTCFTSDFFVEEADEWRVEAWNMIRRRPDLSFLMVTKRIHRFFESLPDDWGDGWDNVIIFSTVESQRTADMRLPIFRAAPIKHKGLAMEPLLERVDISSQLGPWLENVTVGGESGPDARVCDYDWVLDIRAQCLDADVPFTFRQTGANFRKDGKIYMIPRKLQHRQAYLAGINTDIR